MNKRNYSNNARKQYTREEKISYYQQKVVDLNDQLEKALSRLGTLQTELQAHGDEGPVTHADLELAIMRIMDKMSKKKRG